MKDILDKLAHVTASIGDIGFFENLTSFLKSHINFDRLSVDAVFGDLRPIPVYDNCPPEEYDIYTARYLKGPYKLDPVWQYCQQQDTPISKSYTMDDFHTVSFKKSKFYQDYYVQTEVIDEVGFICILEDNRALTLSMVRRRNQRLFSRADMEFLLAYEKIVIAMLKSHWRVLSRKLSSESHTRNINDILDTGLETFAKSILTSKEQKVVTLILQGNDNKNIAHLMDITIGTVKNHRKAIYRKLDITTYAELFSLFLLSLRNVEKAVSADPMVLVENKES
ncbi:response regulator transcription factor [Curvivirga sp.]|uniref:helix-turn-helix transcriptional regulator n=1 Tax=Curvivirga sp. TaxID=2856848 RepID=UPI003B5BDDAE